MNKKIKSLLIQIKMGVVPLQEKDLQLLRNYALRICESTEGNEEEKIKEWYYRDANVMDEILENIGGNIWKETELADFIHQFNSNLDSMPKENICPKCDKKQFSKMDQTYLKLYSQCWSCDKKEWEAGRLSLSEFENRELNSSKLL